MYSQNLLIRQGLLHDNMWDKREYDYPVCDILVVCVTHFKIIQIYVYLNQNSITVRKTCNGIEAIEHFDVC